jgi:hypothetical protein
VSSQGNPSEIGLLLAELCVKLGFCLPPEEQATLEGSPPPGVDALTDAVLLAEGFDPQHIGAELRQQVRDVVAKYVEEATAGSTDESAASQSDQLTS